ncbi:FecCD family ABC transporter permease [Magnetospirillum molischianum]|uniref:Hemin/siderophore transport system permease protein n=1 Tax=Magnetospirillum molischianum DSM 120 TaxID=1150626 RepID=H8FSS5_MAGML|nr:iron ABC transporter permease [Magnetospirillum molischianum]CCG41413.1 Hemin/siderophore transport system permease protein [Magnetospirillum molischianum DSM 120]
MIRPAPEPILVLLLALLAVVSVSLGTTALMPWDVFSANPDRAALARLVIVEIRLPRTLLAVLTGGSLGLAGAVLQGLLRNPLADPGVIGVSAMASLGSVLAFYFGLWSVAAGGICGGLLAAVLLVMLAGRRTGTLTLLLAGVALSSFAVALTALALNLAPSPLAAYEIMFWLLGSVADRSWSQVRLVAPLILLGWGLLLATRRGLSALALGEDVAQSLGVNLIRLRGLAVFGTACCVGAAVAVTGSIGFVGLVVPHLLRGWVGHDSGRLLAVSALGGATLLLAADLVVRMIATGPELKLGVATALVGAPFFLWQVMRMRGPS